MPASFPTDNFDIVVHLLHLKGVEAAARWLTTPNPDLGGLTPDDALTSGRRADVARLVFAGCGEERLAS